jgi:hypothetical protein
MVTQDQRLVQLLREVHWLRIQLIGCMDKDERQLLRAQRVDLERQLLSVREVTA